MAWTDLPTDYTDATFDGLRKFVEITNPDNTVSFQDVTAYSNKEKSFFGAKDANQINKGMNDIMKELLNAVGKKLAGKTVTPTNTGVSVTAGEGAEIFNDYREQTQSGLVKQGNLATGEYSSAHGSGTTASGKCSSADGYCTQANGEYSKANGGLTIADGDCSSSEGQLTHAYGICSHAEGVGSRAKGNVSHTEGNSTTASGENSHAEGKSTTALGDNSHAEGESYNAADSDYTYSTAIDTIISDWQTNPFSLARGKSSHCGGTNTLALGDRSRSEGIYTVAKGVNSYAGGYYTLARAIQFVFGKFNKECLGCENANGNVDTESQLASQSLFIIGNGTSEADSNAFRVSADGQCYGLKAFSAQGADFAEYFEWADGNPDNEDRRGKFVTFDGDKIKLANDRDYILGIVTGSGAFIGNGQSENWRGKYLKDIYGDIITEEVEIPESTDEKTGEVIPKHTVKRFALNPEYDPDSEYVSREFRKEWSPVGMLGQVTLVDDGTCTVNGCCKPSVNGVGTASDSGYRVLKRLDESHVKILVK